METIRNYKKLNKLTLFTQSLLPIFIAVIATDNIAIGEFGFLPLLYIKEGYLRLIRPLTLEKLTLSSSVEREYL